MDDARGSHLSVLIDLSPTQWHNSAQGPPRNTYPLPLNSFLSQLLAFLNSHIASKHENTLAVFGAFPGKSVMLYSTIDPTNHDQAIDANSYPPFRLVDSTIVTRITEELEALGEPEEEAPSSLVSALIKALCYVNRVTLPSVSTTNNPADGHDPAILPDPRILVLSVSPDLSTSYIPIMNAIFSAQKLKVTIDVCQIYGPDTIFLQQAAHLTGGSYIFLERRDALLQYLIMSFLSPPSIRKILSVPTQDKVDFRAACFCHKNIVDIGFVCSVCLSIFCQPVPVCSTCRTKFPMKTLQRLNASRPLLSSSTSNASRTSPSTPQARTPTALGADTGASTTNGARSSTAPLGGLPHSGSIGNGTPRAANINGSRPGPEAR
ncbi:RNA polymerase II transcription factor B subunit 4 [Hypsizygus marmoreus]|uniref:General transcription and DNA repair factor IIH subunit TFB4 n=1 Tax=Hypsizygus marmoreus TaxID=39966 RepID=A0A369JRP7_HYPMA|nr:RNA polymerase II transcription factor B subunit 4 [Hypsizygus marmoreus]